MTLLERLREGWPKPLPLCPRCGNRKWYLNAIYGYCCSDCAKADTPNA